MLSKKYVKVLYRWFNFFILSLGYHRCEAHCYAYFHVIGHGTSLSCYYTLMTWPLYLENLNLRICGLITRYCWCKYLDATKLATFNNSKALCWKDSLPFQMQIVKPISIFFCWLQTVLRSIFAEWTREATCLRYCKSQW